MLNPFIIEYKTCISNISYRSKIVVYIYNIELSTHPMSDGNVQYIDSSCTPNM